MTNNDIQFKHEMKYTARYFGGPWNLKAEFYKVDDAPNYIYWTASVGDAITTIAEVEDFSSLTEAQNWFKENAYQISKAMRDYHSRITNIISNSRKDKL